MHLRGLAAHASEQLRSGYFDVPWEVKDDLQRDAALLHLPSASTLSQAERDGIAALIAALDTIPASVLTGGGTAAAKKALRHPCWKPLRIQASELLQLLTPTTERINAYFGYGRDDVH
ncbi:MAG TPA: hypothetical protein VME21_11855 [Steroidobacteraceae bacterium]|nr:hypothetical protein [Steroidobacteraceae bacterium]